MAKAALEAPWGQCRGEPACYMHALWPHDVVARENYAQRLCMFYKVLTVAHALRSIKCGAGAYRQGRAPSCPCEWRLWQRSGGSWWPAALARAPAALATGSMSRGHTRMQCMMDLSQCVWHVCALSCVCIGICVHLRGKTVLRLWLCKRGRAPLRPRLSAAPHRRPHARHPHRLRRSQRGEAGHRAHRAAATGAAVLSPLRGVHVVSTVLSITCILVVHMDVLVLPTVSLPLVGPV